MTVECEIFIGYDARERLAWEVCARSITAHASLPPPIRPICMQALQLAGLYRRPTVRDEVGILTDVISRAPMSTEFAIARFFVPFLTRAPWALFCDADFMFRADIAELLEHADQRYAVQVVKHADYVPRETVKMDDHPQSAYSRKNWSSLVLWNMASAGAKRLTLHAANTQKGLFLHQFSWLEAHEIGELPAAWNWLEGTSDPMIEPKAVHFTRGVPGMIKPPVAYTSEWCDHISLEQGSRLPRWHAQRKAAA